MLHFSRPELAQAYLKQLREGGEPIALFSPRRTGKTAFLRKDLTPAAAHAGLLAVYVDLWQDKQNPADAIVYALQAALDDLRVPKSRTARGLNTPVRKLGLFGASIDFGADASARQPVKTHLLIDSLLHEVARAAGKKILLMIDEVQQLALTDSGEDLVAAIRASLTRQQNNVIAVLTGSSRDQLNELFFRARAPMYEFASVIKFPLLGRPFVEFAAVRHQRLTGVLPDTGVLLQAFDALEYRPKLLYRLLGHMEENPALDTAAALAEIEAERATEMDLPGLWAGLSSLQKALLVRIAGGASGLYSNEALASYQKSLGVPVNPGSVKSAVNQLRKRSVLSKIGAEYEFEMKAFSAFIRQLAIPAGTKSGPGKRSAAPAAGKKSLRRR